MKSPEHNGGEEGSMFVCLLVAMVPLYRGRVGAGDGGDILFFVEIEQGGVGMSRLRCSCPAFGWVGLDEKGRGLIISRERGSMMRKYKWGWDADGAECKEEEGDGEREDRGRRSTRNK